MTATCIAADLNALIWQAVESVRVEADQVIELRTGRALRPRFSGTAPRVEGVLP